jgi:hypothetical protein
MITAAVISFAILLVAWLVAPSDPRPRAETLPVEPEGIVAEAA